MIQQPKAKKLENMETTLLCLLVWAGLLRGHDGKNVLEFLQSTDLVTWSHSIKFPPWVWYWPINQYHNLDFTVRSNGRDVDAVSHLICNHISRKVVLQSQILQNHFSPTWKKVVYTINPPSFLDNHSSRTRRKILVCRTTFLQPEIKSEFAEPLFYNHVYRKVVED